jgi:hypothetical protein
MATKSKNPNLTLKIRYLTVNFIGLAMMGAVFVYAGVVEVIKWQWAPFTGFVRLEPHTVALLRYIFLALAAGQYLMIKLIRKIVLAQSLDNLPQAAVITFALCESVALLGLVLFLLAGHSLDFYIFMVISLGFFYRFYPKYEQWEKLVSAAGSTRKV